MFRTNSALHHRLRSRSSTDFAASSSEVGLHARMARPVAGGVTAPMCSSCRFRTSRATGQNARQTPSYNARRSRRRAWFPRQDRCRRGRLICRTRIISSACGPQRYEREERTIRIADLHIGKQVEALLKYRARHDLRYFAGIQGDMRSRRYNLIAPVQTVRTINRVCGDG